MVAGSQLPESTLREITKILGQTEHLFNFQVLFNPEVDVNLRVSALHGLRQVPLDLVLFAS